MLYCVLQNKQMVKKKLQSQKKVYIHLQRCNDTKKIKVTENSLHTPTAMHVC